MDIYQIGKIKVLCLNFRHYDKMDCLQSSDDVNLYIHLDGISQSVNRYAHKTLGG